MALNKVLLIGNVGKDPDVRHFEGGGSVANFSLATTERYKDRNGETKDVTEWHNIVCWRQLADLAENYIRKGTQIYVEGKLRTRSYESNGATRYVTEIQADTIQLLGRKGDNPASVGGASTGYSQPAAPATAAAPKPVSQPLVAPESIDINIDDDLPF